MKHYTTIDDMPIWNFRKINETNDLRWMFPNGKGPVSKKIAEAWSKIYDEFIDAFGISDIHRQIMEKKREIAVLTAEMEMNDDRSTETFIDIARFELSELLKQNNEGTPFNKVKASVEKFMGFHINEKETSIKDFYSYVQLMQEKPAKAAKYV